MWNIDTYNTYIYIFINIYTCTIKIKPNAGRLIYAIQWTYGIEDFGRSPGTWTFPTMLPAAGDLWVHSKNELWEVILGANPKSGAWVLVGRERYFCWVGCNHTSEQSLVWDVFATKMTQEHIQVWLRESHRLKLRYHSLPILVNLHLLVVSLQRLSMGFEGHGRQTVASRAEISFHS